MPGSEYVKTMIALRDAAKAYVQADEHAGDAQSPLRGEAFEALVTAAEAHLEARRTSAAKRMAHARSHLAHGDTALAALLLDVPAEDAHRAAGIDPPGGEVG